jgi:Fur family ferric uptake transcriptional regulator
MGSSPAEGVRFPPGVRLTAERRALAAALAELHGRFTAAELHERARRRHPGLGLATTYRALELFRQAGTVRPLPGEGAPAYIRCRPGHHHHLVCLGCGDVEETELCGTPAAEEIRRRHGFQATGHDLEIYGLCARCA